MNKIMPTKLYIFISVLLFIAMAPMPYVFYDFTRIIVTGCAGYVCYQLWNTGYRGVWLAFWPLIAILFNPIA